VCTSHSVHGRHQHPACASKPYTAVCTSARCGDATRCCSSESERQASERCNAPLQRDVHADPTGVSRPTSASGAQEALSSCCSACCCMRLSSKRRVASRRNGRHNTRQTGCDQVVCMTCCAERHRAHRLVRPAGISAAPHERRPRRNRMTSRTCPRRAGVAAACAAAR
jgi:hypothetical protein